MEYNEVKFSCLQNFGRQFPQLLSAEYGMYPMIGESYCINIYFDQTFNYVQIKFWSGVSQVSQAGASHFCLSLMFWSHPYLITSLLLCFPAGIETTDFSHFHIQCSMHVLMANYNTKKCCKWTKRHEVLSHI